jgi:hypothetical protein
MLVLVQALITPLATVPNAGVTRTGLVSVLLVSVCTVVCVAKLKLATICAPVVGGLRLPSPRASYVVASTPLSHPELINVPLANVLLSDI